MREPIEHFLNQNGELIYLQEDPYTGAIRGVRLTDQQRIRIENMGFSSEYTWNDSDNFYENFARAFVTLNS